jgi:hypothetical protein
MNGVLHKLSLAEGLETGGGGDGVIITVREAAIGMSYWLAWQKLL